MSLCDPQTASQRAERVIQFIIKYCRTPEGAKVGAPVELADFQVEFIRAVYGNPNTTRRAYLSIARKNGKSTLIAAIALAHIVGPEARQNSQIIAAARSRDQAGLIYKAAEKMIMMNPALQQYAHLVPSKKMIMGLSRNVEFRAISSDAKTAHGLSPVLAIIDEIGQVEGPQDPLVDAIVTAQGAHESPLLMAISTQAATDADLFSVWLDDAETSDDPQIISHVYTAPEGCELMDESAWRAANPALGIFRSYEDVRKQAEQAARMPSFENTFRLLTLNQRVSMNSPFVGQSVWKACEGDLIPLEDCDVVYGGIDLSARNDLTAAVFVGIKDGIAYTHPFFWTPGRTLAERARRDRAPYEVWVQQGYLNATDGAAVDYEVVARDLIDILESCNIAGVAYDAWRIDVLRKEFERLGYTMDVFQEFRQGFVSMSPAIEALEAAILNQKLVHNSHPVMNFCAANAQVIMSEQGNRKFSKKKQTARIDGMVALAMAMGTAFKQPEAQGGLNDFLNNPVIV